MVTETHLKAGAGGLIDQYKTAANLEARISLHERFSVSEKRWPEWVFEQFDFPPDCRIMELGCGLGTLWAMNRGRRADYERFGAVYCPEVRMRDGEI